MSWTNAEGLAHREAINRGLSARSPHSAAKASRVGDEQAKCPIYNGRPPTNCAFDVRLFHPAFENFSRRYHGTEELKKVDMASVHTFLVSFAEHYESEHELWRRITPYLNALLGRDFADIEDPDGIHPDGAVVYTSGQTLFAAPLLVVELESEIGGGDADATMQAGLSYRRFWAHNQVFICFSLIDLCSPIHQKESRASCCPAFLLAIMGPWICVLGAVFTDKPIVQPLTPLLWLGRMKSQYEQVTRVFAALSMGIDELQDSYSKVDFSRVSSARFFPYITSFKTNTGQDIQFSYERYAEPYGQISKPVFVGRTEDDQKIIVKFTEAYNDEAHILLAEEGFAPPLLHCNRETFQDFTMVIMGYVDGKQLFQKYSDKVLGEVSKALAILHSKDLVFGDLRSPNILVTNEDKVQLVDFDWCGKKGEGTYPVDINLVDIQWPEGVVPGGYLQVEHDEEMYQMLSLQ